MKHKTLILSALAGVLAISTGAQDKPKVKPQRIQLQVRPGSGAVTKQSVTIGSHCIIGAGAVIKTDVKSNQIIKG